MNDNLYICLFSCNLVQAEILKIKHIYPEIEEELRPITEIKVIITHSRNTQLKVKVLHLKCYLSKGTKMYQQIKVLTMETYISEL